jgi:hypothetical protein
MLIGKVVITAYLVHCSTPGGSYPGCKWGSFGIIFIKYPCLGAARNQMISQSQKIFFEFCFNFLKWLYNAQCSKLLLYLLHFSVCSFLLLGESVARLRHFWLPFQFGMEESTSILGGREQVIWAESCPFPSNPHVEVSNPRTLKYNHSEKRSLKVKLKWGLWNRA